MRFRAFSIFLKQYWLIFVAFQIALGFLIPHADPGQYLFTFLFVKSIAYGALTTYFKRYALSKLYIYMNLGVNPNTLLLSIFGLDSLLSIGLILTIT